MSNTAISLSAARTARKPAHAATIANKSDLILDAATRLEPRLQSLQNLDAASLRTAMTSAFGGSDNEGLWLWKDAYEASEAALIQHITSDGSRLFTQSITPDHARISLDVLSEMANCEPSHTRRSLEQLEYQQFSTPLAIAWCAFIASGMKPADVFLEPSAGTGMLAIFPSLFLAGRPNALYLNEIAPTRADMLRSLFPDAAIHCHNAESIADRLPQLRPSVVIMNPPFSASPNMNRKVHGADLKHLKSAFSMLPAGGRLVVITSANCKPGSSTWNDAFETVSGPPGSCVFTRVMDGSLYRRRGTTFETRLTVIDRACATAPPIDVNARVSTPAELLDAILAGVPPRMPLSRVAEPALDLFGVARPGPQPVTERLKPAGTVQSRPPTSRSETAGGLGLPDQHSTARDFGPISELQYGVSPQAADQIAGSYASWTPTVVHIDAADSHPTHLIQSAAMSAVSHVTPTYQPLLPESIVTKAQLSDAQLESVVLAGQAHNRLFDRQHRVQSTFDKTVAVDTEDQNSTIVNGTDPEQQYSSPVRFRVGWMLGDGTGTGKGRQVAAIILDQWLRGRKRALWLSQSDKLLEDARRDWTALGGMETDVFPLGKFRQDVQIPMDQGILFSTYATLRSAPRAGKISRLDQIIHWLAGSESETDRHAFDGVIIFDEAHAMANAAGGKGSRGDTAPSQQGLAGIRLQNALPQARVVLVSATGATTLAGLSYAVRLGLWGSGTTPFETRTDFLSSMTAGGVAALEVVARDLKAMGLYQSRALSYEGVEIDILEHALTPEQQSLYDEWAMAFRIIHNNIHAALEATGITRKGKTLSRAAKSAAVSTFEGTKQRFFAHMLNAMKCPSLIRAIEHDLDEGNAPVVQLVSTGESLMERQIANIPPSEWDDVQIDLTPRDNIIEYLQYSFPTQLHEPYTDGEGNEMSRPVFDENGAAVQCVEALRKRDDLVLKLASLPATPTALDQILHHFGHDQVAEVTGRTRRVIRTVDAAGDRLQLRGRPASANLTETQAFMSGKKRILVFSMAGGTGRSYHSDLSCANQSRRIHYLLEPGWRADQAIQGLGRTHRTHQANAPLFRPVTTDVKGERRFTATIARRLDALGALTRGQRNSQTEMAEKKSLFRASDNFESPYALAALRQFYSALHLNYIENWPISRFEETTGLKLTDQEGLKRDLPPMSRVLNRLLALPIAEQNELFEALETRVDANIARAIEAGTFETGVETLVADSFTEISRETIDTGAAATTELVEILQRNKLVPLTPDEAIERADTHPVPNPDSRLLVNRKSNRAAIMARTTSIIDDNGAVKPRIALIRPDGRDAMTLSDFSKSTWDSTDQAEWRAVWETEIDSLPPWRERRFWLATGMLLSIWDKLPEDNLKVRRLTTDAGVPLIGRVLDANQTTKVRAAFGLDGGPAIEPEELFSAIIDGGASYTLHNGWRLSRRSIAGEQRVELAGPINTDLSTLSRMGLVTEIISYRARIFLPSVDVLRSVVEKWPLTAD